VDRDLTQATRARRTLVFGSVTHVWNDLLFALFIPLLPLIRDDPELGLSYTQVGLLRTAHAGASTALQIPFGFLAERTGEFWLLLGGNAWAALGLVILAGATAFPWLLSWTLIGGLGGSTQHPLASGLVSRVYDASGRSTAIGTVNFAGDLGKMAAPAVALVLAPRYGWRATMRFVGLAGVVSIALFGLFRRGLTHTGPAGRTRSIDAGSDGLATRGGFILLSVAGFMDSAARRGALVFLPFLMRDKGMGTEQFLVMTFLLLTGGAAGKLVCGWLDERYGSVSIIWGTKALSAALLVATLFVPVWAMAPTMVLLGIGLNGTSSVLYATVATFVPPRLRSRYYGFFYTTSEGGTTIAPLLLGLLADLVDVRTAVAVMAVATAMILPVSLPLRRHLGDNAPVGAGKAGGG